MIVISYSSIHFHPVTQPTPIGSAGTIAKQIYEEAIKYAGVENVLYVDSDTPETWGEQIEAEALIARASNYGQLRRHFKPKKDLLIAVNQHPQARKKLRKLIALAGLPSEAVDSTDGVFESGKQIASASKVILVGNGITRSTYLANGFKSKDLFALTYNPEPIPFSYKWTNGNLVLAHVGSIGFRKGADILIKLSDYLRESNSKMRLCITGEPVNAYWAEQLQQALLRNSDNLMHIGWIDTKSEEFLNLLSDVKFAVFPTREEGLSGAFLEIANLGIPVLTTNQVGIENLSNLTSESIDDFQESFNALMKMQDSDVEKISRDSRKWFQSVSESQNQLREAVQRFLQNGKVWPRADIKLCVHNKANTIKNLIEGWSKAAELTDNTSITIIDDGSSDHTSVEIEKALKRKVGFQDSKQMYLPDVFEVKSNNAAILATSANYHIIVQDDNYLTNYDLLPEMLALADKSRNIAALGGLAGANFYPITEECVDHAPGQHALNANEHYWRQDSATDPLLTKRYFEVDVVMRGPLLMSDKALRELGPLDEEYAPLYMDDVEWCTRARKSNWRVVALLGGVVNKSESMANATETQNSIYKEAYERNTKKYYSTYDVEKTESQIQLHRDAWESSKTSFSTRIKLIILPELRQLPQKSRIFVYANYPGAAKKLQTIKHWIKK